MLPSAVPTLGPHHRKGTTVLVNATGTATPDDVWQRYTNPMTWSDWAPQITAVEYEGETLRPGTTGRVVASMGVTLDFEVEDVDATQRSWSWRVGRGNTSVLMHHAVVPTGDGRTMATMRIDGALATVLQPYRLIASRALRGLVEDGNGRGKSTDETVVRHPFAFSPGHRRASRIFGITPDNSWVDLGPQWLTVRYGPWQLLTPRDNVVGHEITEDFDFLKTAGPPHLSMADRGVSFTPNGERALCVSFQEPVPAIDPTGMIRHPAATLGVLNPEALAAGLDAGA